MSEPLDLDAIRARLRWEVRDNGKKHGPRARRLAQDIEDLIAEVERLKANEARLRADDFDDDLDLPGMWERADFTGGVPDAVYPPTAEVERLRRVV